MASYNRVILVGNLVHSPELSHKGGTAICKLSLAVNSKRKQGDQYVDEVSYFDCVAFGKTGEAIAEYVGKGQSILIDGRLKQERWDDKEGKKRSAVRVYIDTVQFLSPKKEAEAAASQPESDEIPF